MYRSKDAGRSWTPMGLTATRHIARIVIHPRNPEILYVAAVGELWSANEERGVFRTQDGGLTWEKVLYIDQNTGAIDLVMDPGDPNTLFAAMYQRRRTAWGFNGGGPGSGLYRTLDGGDSWTEQTNGLPDGDMGRIGLDIYRRDGDLVFASIETPGEAQGIYVSTDRGESWEQRSRTNQRPMYFSQIRVDPNNENVLYTGGVSAYKSVDGGKTWRQLEGHGHVDHHAIWIDPNDSRHVMYGNDGSVDVSFDGGDTWESLRTWAVGQPYHVSVDMRRPYFVCTGLQDNGTWCGPSSVRNGPILKEDWYGVGGGDGFYSAMDPTDPAILFSESQNGNIRRVNLREGES
ncbi:MAG: WD40/YVTN/BNR-like repeat-containing protein, partial [Planctomycetaceae bacterium]